MDKDMIKIMGMIDSQSKLISDLICMVQSCGKLAEDRLGEIGRLIEFVNTVREAEVVDEDMKNMCDYWICNNATLKD